MPLDLARESASHYGVAATVHLNDWSDSERG